MDATVERRAREVFLAALDLTDEEREEYFRRTAESEPEAVARACSLFDACRDPGDDFEPQIEESPLSEFVRGAFEDAVAKGEVEWVPPSFRTALLGDRFRMGPLIGKGRFGAVYLAEDELLGGEVAVKVLFGPDAVLDVAAPRERIALLALDVPDVVRLVDFGTFEGRPYLVTEYFDGAHFPGAVAAGDWNALSGAAVTLLEALSRVHASGVIHGDLKPANVLVTDGGQLRLVDLGVAMGSAVTYRGEGADAWGGTLPFLAPELCVADPAGPSVRSDLFAVGVMIYRALTGAVPQLESDASPVDSLARDTFLRRRADEPIDLTPLRDVELPAVVRQVLASLLARDPARRPVSAADAVALLRGERPPVEVVAAQVGALAPEGGRLSREQLRSLFAGPERLFQIPQDAAELVGSRTGGEPRAVVDELSGWVRGGFAGVRDGRLALDRSALGRIESLPPAEGPVLRDLDVLSGGEDLRLLDLIVAAGATATVSLLADVLELPRAVVQRDVRRLCDIGVVQRLEDGGHRALFTAPGWNDPLRRTWAHAALSRVLPVGAHGRLRHLVEARRFDAIAEDAVAGARDAWGLGDATRSRTLLVTALAVVRAANRSAVEEAALVRELLEAGIAASSPQALRLALHEAHRSRLADDRMHGVYVLARAALAAIVGDGRGALALVDSIDMDPDDLQLGYCRQRIRAFASYHVPSLEAQRVIASACDWGDAHADDPHIAVGTSVWRSALLFRAGRYREALEAGRAGVRAARTPRERLSTLLCSMTAALEVYELDAVQDDALQARDVARSARHPMFEARAEYYARAALYRAERDPAPDPELLEAVRHLRDTVTLAYYAMLEAVIAWRGGDDDTARDLALEAAASWSAIGEREGTALLRALAAASGDEESIRERGEALGRVATSERPGMALQIIGLHALADRGSCPVDLDVVRELVGRVGDVPLDRRREILSIEECLRFVGS